MWPQMQGLTLRAKYRRVLESSVRWHSAFDWRTISPPSGSNSSGRLRDPAGGDSTDPSLNFTNSLVPFQHYLKTGTSKAQFQIILKFRIITKSQYLKTFFKINIKIYFRKKFALTLNIPRGVLWGPPLVCYWLTSVEINKHKIFDTNNTWITEL